MAITTKSSMSVNAFLALNNRLTIVILLKKLTFENEDQKIWIATDLFGQTPRARMFVDLQDKQEENFGRIHPPL
jgi:hypothetical protein